MLERTPLEEDRLAPIVLKATGANAPARAKMAVAKGILPMGPADLGMALYQLSLDSAGEVREAVAKTAAGLPDAVIESLFSTKPDVRVLDFFSDCLRERSQWLQRLILLRETHSHTITRLAKWGDEATCEAIGVDEERIYRNPEILEALYFNKNARMSTVDRLLEIAGHRGIVLEGIPMGRETGDSPIPAAELDAQFERALSYGDEEESLAPDEEDAEQKEIQISKLPMHAKIRLATLGTAFHRGQLIKDNEKLVAMACIRSPGVGDSEAAKYSAMRNLDDGVIRYIANNKAWLRLYGIKKNLVTNPKTPLAVAMRLLAHLRSNDLRGVARSKEIPSALARAAKQRTGK